MAQNIVQNAFRVVEGRAVTSSFKVAEYFGKKHSDVVRAVDDLIAKKSRTSSITQFCAILRNSQSERQGCYSKGSCVLDGSQGLLSIGYGLHRC